MRAMRVVITGIGGPEVLKSEEFDPPLPGRGEIAVAVRAAGLNFADLFCRLGLYAAAPPVPFTPGFEVAGEVAAFTSAPGGVQSVGASPGVVQSAAAAPGGARSAVEVGGEVAPHREVPVRF